MRKTLATGALLGATALTAGLLLGSPAAQADATSPGHYCSLYDGVAVRTEPDGTARDNLAKDQTFQVQTVSPEGRWTYGYKIVNGVHGYVLSSSLYAC